MQKSLQIPLHDFHARHGARFVDFGGWCMPVQYSSILEEHKAVRSAAGLFDVSHMGEFLVTGPNAEAFLDRLLVNRIAHSQPGKAIYSPLCAENGSVIDDLIVYRIDECEFLVCVNAGNIDKDYDWFESKVSDWKLNATVENQSDAFALLALQGPAAMSILHACGLTEASKLKRFNHLKVTYSGAALRICRTGYTGEDGFEIYVAPDKVEELATRILAEGQSSQLKLCGLGARDSLRLEAGLPLYGHEISDQITPLEAGLDWTVKFDKADFVGKDALAKQKQAGVSRRVIHFKLEGRRIAREATPVINADAKEIGRVLSGTLSPMTGSPIGSALVQANCLSSELFVDLRGNKLPLQIAQPPLHHPDSN